MINEQLSIWMRFVRGLLLVVAMVCLALLSGCIPQQQLNSLDRRVNGLSVENETQAREIAALRNQVNALRGQAEGDGSAVQDIEHLRSSLADTAGRVEQIQAELLRLNGQIEQMSQSLADQKEELRKLKAGALGPKSGAVGTSQGGSGASVPEVKIEPDLYQQAIDLVRAKKYREAKKTLLQYVKENPRGDRVSNAHFWMGECEYNMGRYEEAILEYQTVISKYPKSNKLPDALFKQGLAFERLGDMESARIVLSKLIKKFPGTSQAKVAAKRLKHLK